MGWYSDGGLSKQISQGNCLSKNLNSDPYFFDIRIKGTVLIQSIFVKNSRVFLLRQIWIVNYYVECSLDNLSNENKNIGVFREMIFQK